MVRITEESSRFITEDDSFLKERDICVALILSARVPRTHQLAYLVLVLNEHLLSRLRIQSKFQRREQIRILERKPQLSLIISGALLERLQNILRNALQLLSREPDAIILLIQILLELDLDLFLSASIPAQHHPHIPDSTAS